MMPEVTGVRLHKGKRSDPGSELTAGRNLRMVTSGAV